MIKRNKSALCLIILSCCQSIPKPIGPVLPPARMAKFFDSCRGGDGELLLEIDGDTGFIGETTIGWLDRPGKAMTVELYDPLGQTILNLNYFHKKRKFWAQGYLASRIPAIGVNPSGFLIVDDHSVPIKPKELICLCKFKLPLRWLDNVYEYSTTLGKAYFKIYEKDRSISLKLSESGSTKNRKICATIEWGVFLGLITRKMKICQNHINPATGTIVGIGDYSITWTNNDDG